MPADTLTVSVDRIVGATVVLEADDGRQFEVPVRQLASKPTEGLIYEVPVDPSGQPIWDRAVVDARETHRRRTDLEQRMKKLRGRDPGGDIDL